jgi:hypothetical protein
MSFILVITTPTRMNLLCPNCQKMLQVPDQFAGQMMKCPLCQGSFTVPALPQAPSLPPAPPPPSYVPPAPAVKTGPDGAAAKAPTSSAGYEHVRSFALSPVGISWIAPAALLIALALLFFPWIEGGIYTSDNTLAATGLQAAFGEVSSGLGKLYLLIFLAAVGVALIGAVVPMLPSQNLPPAVQQFMPLRPAAVALFTLLALSLLVIQVVIGFGPESGDSVWFDLIGSFSKLERRVRIFHTGWLRLTVFLHVIALVGAGLDTWLALRGPNKPAPRVDVQW